MSPSQGDSLGAAEAGGSYASPFQVADAPGRGDRPDGRRDEGVLIYRHEQFYRPHMSNHDIIDGLYEGGVKRSDLIAADSAERDRIDEIYRDGFNIHRATKDVTYGLDYVRRFTLRVTEGSDNLRREVQTYKWRKDKNGHVLDAPVRFNNHAIDAGWYAAVTGAEYFGLYEPLKPTGPEPQPQPRPRRRKRNSLDFDGYYM